MAEKIPTQEIDSPAAVRFAPSPTGRMHVGNARTALFNFLLARRSGGTFLLRVDDTDVGRCRPEFEDGIGEDLVWLGIVADRKIRQSERVARYDSAVANLRQRGLLYPCYETPEELERRRRLARAAGRPPVYDRAALRLAADERAALEAEGRRPHWRFRLSGVRRRWVDLVRGEQEVDTGSVSDPVLIRADGTFLYTLPSVVDDIEEAITHVVRGEDHVTNSGVQMEIFEALGANTPLMAHLALLTDEEGDPLSKRLGSLGIVDFRDKGLNPMAMVSYLAGLGMSAPVEATTEMESLIGGFDYTKASRAPARFSTEALWSINAGMLRVMPYSEVETRLREMPLGKHADEAFWSAVAANLDRIDEAACWLTRLFGEPVPVATMSVADRSFLADCAAMFPEGDVDSGTFDKWTREIRQATGRRAKALYMPLRMALTGTAAGPEMGSLLSLMGRDRILARLEMNAADTSVER